MFDQDNSNKCNIIDTLLINDLESYKLVDFNDNLYINYTDNIEYRIGVPPSSNSKLISIKYNVLENIIRSNGYSSVFANDSPLHDIWLPLFIDQTSSDISNKLITRGTSIEKTQLGIENFISFVPKFKNWTVSDPLIPMATDWILTSPFAGYNAQYGLLCWIKYSNKSISSLKSDTFKLLESFPIGSRLATDIAGWTSHFIKVDNNKLLILDQDDSIITGTSISYKIGSNVIESSDISNDAKFRLVRPDSDKFYGGNNAAELWIPDGDFYTYLEDHEPQYNSLVSSKSYISPLLYNRYIQIYHILTLNEIKYLDKPKLIIQSRALKRLCYALATSPLIDNVCHNYLNTTKINSLVKNYLEKISYDNITDETSWLRNVLISIFIELKNLNEKLNKKTLNNNYIVSRRDLFNKLTSKYISNLVIGQGALCEISYKNLLKHGDHLLINQSINSYCSKNTTKGTIIYNNQKIQLNNISITTDINLNKSEINLNDTKILPLTDIIKDFSRDLEFSIGPDQIYQYTTDYTGEIELEIEGIVDSDFTGLQGYSGPKNYTWEQISGPCLRFSDNIRDSFKQVKFTYSTDIKPVLYIYGPGIYTIKCTIITDIGTVVSSKTIYVLKKDHTDPLPTLKPVVLSKLESGGLKVMCPNLNTIAIHKRGIFWPIKTDLFIGKYNSIYDDQFIRLQGSEKFVFDINKNNISHSNSRLRLIYNSNNTTIKISRYILQNMRNETEECSQCKTFYKDLIVSDKTSYYHRQKYPDQINLPRFIIINNKTIKLNDISFNYPDISTKYAPPIKTYGGYKNDYPYIEIPYSDVDETLPKITGHDLLYPNRICFETNENDYLMISDSAVNKHNDPVENTLNGSRCSFIPNTGVIIGDTYQIYEDTNLVEYPNPYIDKTSILKFNPGARSYFSFKGGGFKNLSSSISGNYITPNIFKSSITLNIDPRIVPELPKDGSSKKEIEEIKIKNQKKELKDHEPHHGYRYLNDGIVNIENDEYGYFNSSLIRTNANCDGSEIAYSFSSLGPKVIDPSDPTKLQDIVVPSFSIQDLSVKLNFLNYVNTKNLVVWLDVDVCSAEAQAITGPPPRCQLKVGGISPDIACLASPDYERFLNRFAYKENGTMDYFKNLNNMNYNPNKRTQLRLYLLNQEHIQNNTYNFSVEFTDNAPEINKAHDFHVGSGFLYKQNIISNNDRLRPTTMASGYTDHEHIVYGNILNNIDTKSWFTNNTFKKFKSFPLFNGLSSESSTKFTLNIAVIDEPDEMRVFDNIYNNNDLLKGFNGSINKQQSSYIYSSLCSWEINIKTDEKERISNDTTGPLGLIEYDKSPSYPGYTYLTTIKRPINNENIEDTSLSLPTLNNNAPFTFLNNNNLCRFQDYESLQNLISEEVVFPIQAIMEIIGAISLLSILGLSGGSVGAIAAAGSINALTDPAYKLISNYFADRRRQQSLEEINEFFDRADYSNYPFGSSEKILISVAKPSIDVISYNDIELNPIWYKMEASIFKLDNLPILERNKYKYIRLDKDTLPEFSRFKFDIVSSSEELVDNELIQKFLTTTSTTNIVLSGYGPVNNILLKDDDIVNVTGQTDPLENAIYTVSSGRWIRFPYGYITNRKLSQYIRWRGDTSGSKQNLGTINTLINNKQLILVEGRLIFDLLNTGIAGAGSSYPLEFCNENNTSTFIGVKNVGLITKNNKFYSLIHLENSVSGIFFSLVNTQDKNIILVFKNDSVSINAGQTIPMNIWGLEKKQLQKQCPYNPTTRKGIGSYGDGSPYINKNILTYNAEDISLPSIYEQFHDEDKLKLINCEITYSDGKDIKKLNFDSDVSLAFDSLDKKSDIFVNNEMYINLNNDIPDELKKAVFYSITNTDFNEKNYFYMYLSKRQQNILPKYGEITFSNDMIHKEPPLLESDAPNVYKTVVDRLEFLNKEKGLLSNILGVPAQTSNIIDKGTINEIETHYNQLPEDDNPICYKSVASNCYKKITKQALYDRYAERNELLSYLELRKKSIVIKPRRGLISGRFVKIINDPKDINRVRIKFEDRWSDQYLINIDPKQECSLDTDLTFKILKKITYQCVPLLGIIVDPDSANICAQSTKGFTTDDGNIEFINKGDTFEYQFSTDKIKDATGLTDSSYWKDFIVEREFFINANGPRDTLVKVTEYYDIINDKHPDFTASDKNDGSSIPNRVYNIVGLSDDRLPDITYQIKNIPRKLKGVDKHYDRYIPNKDGALVRLVAPSAGGPISNSIRFWRCLDPNEKKLAETTPYLKAQNEMIYRAFFNSADGIEHKINVMESLYPWEWIPYEYDL